MKKLTVVCRETGYPDQILIYHVEASPEYAAEVMAAVEVEREKDIGENVEMEVLFAFDGSLNTVADWRE